MQGSGSCSACYRLEARRPARRVAKRLEGRYCVVEEPVRAVLPREACEELDRLASGRGSHLLLLGPPGTGKTIFMRLVAETVPFNVVEVEVERLFSGIVGQAEERFAEILSAAETSRPAVLLFDEADMLLRKRGALREDGYEVERSNMMRMLLRRMQRWSEAGGVYVVAASNVPLSEVDPALVRAMRFKALYFPVPDEEAARLLFRLYGRDPPPPEELRELIMRAPSFANLVDYIRTGRVSRFELSPFVKVVYGTPLGCKLEATRAAKVPEHHPTAAVVAALHAATAHGSPLLLLLDPERYEDVLWLSESLGWPVAVPYSPLIEHKVYSVVYRARRVYLLGREWNVHLDSITYETLIHSCGEHRIRKALGCRSRHPRACLQEYADRLF